MDKARKLADRWIDAWNTRDLAKLLSMYDTNLKFSSQRMTTTYKRTGIGSPDGIISAIDALGAYFREAIDNLKVLHLSLETIMEGTEGKHALLYTRETGARVLECHTADQASGKIIEVEVFYDIVV